MQRNLPGCLGASLEAKKGSFRVLKEVPLWKWSQGLHRLRPVWKLDFCCCGNQTELLWFSVRLEQGCSILTSSINTLEMSFSPLTIHGWRNKRKDCRSWRSHQHDGQQELQARELYHYTTILRRSCRRTRKIKWNIPFMVLFFKWIFNLQRHLLQHL